MPGGNARHAWQRTTFRAGRTPKWLRGCACDRELHLRKNENAAMCTVCHGVGSKRSWQKHVRLHAPSQHVECGRRRGESCASRSFRVYKKRTFNSKCNPWATWASQLPRSRPVAARGARFHAARTDAAGAPNCATVAISGGPWGESRSLKIYMYRAAGSWPDAQRHSQHQSTSVNISQHQSTYS